MDYTKDVQSTPTHHFWMNWKNIFFIFFRMCDVTLRPDPLPPQNDVTNCQAFGTPSPLRRDVIFERPLTDVGQRNGNVRKKQKGCEMMENHYRSTYKR